MSRRPSSAADRRRRSTAIRKSSLNNIAIANDASNVKVFCRIRPLNSMEAENGSTCLTQMEDQESLQIAVSILHTQ